MKHSILRLTTLIALAMFIAIGSANAEDWARFRGTDADGTGSAARADGPVKWSSTDNIVWKTAMPGAGTSSPTLWGDKIFLTAYSGYGVNKDEPGDPKDLKLHVLCLDRANGKPLWDYEFSPRIANPDYKGFMALHGYASPTAAVDADAIYCFFGTSGVIALTHDGQPLWTAYVGDTTHGWGYATSPILYQDLVIVNASVESQSVVALNRKTGDEVWRYENVPMSWGTPAIVTADSGREELVVSMKEKIVGLDPLTGKEYWNCVGVQDYVCPSVIANDGICYITAGRKPEFFAIRAGGSGDVSESHVLWHVGETSKVGTPLYHEGLLYFIDQRAIAYCLDAKNGEVKYEERLDVSGRGDKVYASYVLMGDKLYGVSREGGTIVVAVGPQFSLVAHNFMEDDDSVANATPTPDAGQLLLRSDKYLYCIGK